MLAREAGSFDASSAGSTGSSAAGSSPLPTVPAMAVPEGDEKLRGRRWDRNGERPDDEEAAAAAAEAQGSGASSAEDLDADGPSRKRRRSRKALDKKFPCPWAECGKSYSRAEHLYRHQLNRKLPPSPPPCRTCRDDRLGLR